MGDELLRMADVRVWVPGPDGPSVLLDGIDWVVGEGQHWALLGPNGAGKSTLLRIAGGVHHQSSGDVHVLGRRLGRVDIRTLWPSIGFVNPVRRFSADMTVGEVVLTGASGTIHPLWQQYGASEQARAEELLALMGIERLADRTIGTVSDGERGRTLIARSLMPSPRLLLLDEPTAGLDMAGREQLLASLHQLAAAEPSLASVVVAHHLEDLPTTTTHAMLLAGGRRQAAGPVAEVLTDCMVSRCFGISVHIARHEGRWSAVHLVPAAGGCGPGRPEGPHGKMSGDAI